MSTVSRVPKPPSKPLLVWDGDCNFCGFWVRKLQRRTGDTIAFREFQDPGITETFPEIPRQQYERAVQLILQDGRVLSGADAIFTALADFGNLAWPRSLYGRVPLARTLAERAYAFVASHRILFSRLTRLGWGTDPEPASYRQTSAIFLRFLAIIYFVGFVSLDTQVLGLIGENGITSAKTFLHRAGGYFNDTQVGARRYLAVPTLGWFSASDGALRTMTLSGAAVSIVLLLGILPRVSLLVLWSLYLSLANLGGVFLQFQWDALLLETGLLAVFLAPNTLLSRPSRGPAPSSLAIWLLRWLLFRLLFESGCVKLLSGDPLWHQLSALEVHFETQPLPTWLGWYAHQAPPWALKTACASMFFIELFVPFLFFGPPRIRRCSFWPLLALQIGILLTGNYGFFNWLAICLGLVVLDDRALPRILQRSTVLETHTDRKTWSRLPIWVFTALVLLITSAQLLGMFGVGWIRTRAISAVCGIAAPFRSINSYGLFAVMTRTRPEILVEGSHDGQTWQAYRFKYKPQDLERRPGFVAPHQPRLDWQMWFAALSSYRENPWFVNFCLRLLQREPSVLALLERDPFPDKAPELIRVTTYEYRFTRSTTSNGWWTRERKGEYLPPIRLQPARE